MKTAREYISELRLNKANVDHCVQYNTINGTLLIDLESMLKDYAKQCVEQSLKDAAYNLSYHAFSSRTEYDHAQNKILSTPIVTP